MRLYLDPQITPRIQIFPQYLDWIRRRLRIAFIPRRDQSQISIPFQEQRGGAVYLSLHLCSKLEQPIQQSPSHPRCQVLSAAGTVRIKSTGNFYCLEWSSSKNEPKVQLTAATVEHRVTQPSLHLFECVGPSITYVQILRGFYQRLSLAQSCPRRVQVLLHDIHLRLG